MQRQRVADALVPGVDLILLVLVIPCAALLWAVRRLGLQRLSLCRRMLIRLRLLPIRHHYYEPFTTPSDLRYPLDRKRQLPGVDWNESAQLAYLERLVYAHEIPDMNAARTDPLEFRLDNGSFGSGDAEFLYQLVRDRKPRRVFEIGSGNSTLVVRAALQRNRQEDPAYDCRHLCVEPYEAPWLERAVSQVYRRRVEDVDSSLFGELEANDLLFIDSSHVIRPQGDVVTEYLQILPALRAGVIVHVHDIFSPRDYLTEWVTKRMWLWNEQYLLEAFLTGNDSWEVLAGINMLKHDHFAALQRVCPYLTTDREPGSFYIRRVR
jgi:predicted O-methyltransferase YrrM